MKTENIKVPMNVGEIELPTEQAEPAKEKLTKLSEKVGNVIKDTSQMSKFFQLANIEFYKNPLLNRCDSASIGVSLINIARLGLMVGTGDAYLIPFRSNSNGSYSCTTMIGYLGMIKILYNCGVTAVRSEVIYSNDEFDHNLGTNPFITHKRALKDRGEIIGAYANVIYNGNDIIEIIDKEEIEKARSCSKTKQGNFWEKHYNEMAKKTAIRRIFKKLPNEIPLVFEILNQESVQYKETKTSGSENLIKVLSEDMENEND